MSKSIKEGNSFLAENNVEEGNEEHLPLLQKLDKDKQGRERLPSTLGGGLTLNIMALFGFLPYVQSLRKSFGGNFLILLGVSQHMLKGFVLPLIGQATPWLLMAYQIPAPQVQGVIGAVTGVPWAIKPVIGLVSDILPIGGWHKAPYILMTSLLGGFGLLYLGLAPNRNTGMTMLIVCLFLSQLQISTVDLLSEAKYAEKIKLAPAKGPALLTYVWFGMQVAALVALILGGEVLSHFSIEQGPRILFIVSAVPALGLMIPVAMGYLEEKRATPEEVSMQRKRHFQNKEASFLCLLIFTGSITICIVSLVWQDPAVNFFVALAIGIMMLFAFSVLLSPVIAKFNAFSLIQTSLGLSTGGASFYFYTDTEVQYPEGPHFTPLFFNTVLGVVAIVASMFGIFVYQRFMSGWKYRSLLICTNVVISCFAAIDIMMFARLNVKVGIPDRALVFGLSVCEGVILQWQWMPQVVILAYMCPKGMEATMYALLAGCHNLGGTIANTMGAFVLQRMNVRPSGMLAESAQFDNLWKVSTISTVLPLVAILVLWPLIPDARQNEQLVCAAEDATKGSAWRKWTRQSVIGQP
jgi:MFS family permease